jgi:hypothetical protein
MKERKRIAQQRQYLLEKLSSDELLKSAQSLTSPSSFIVPYDPADAVAADEVRHGLVGDLAARGIRVADVNVYDVALATLDGEGLYEDLVGVEPDVGKQDFTDALKDAVDVEKELVPRIKEAAAGYDLLFLSGVGECYPFVRTHRLLENLTVPVPVVTFFPGRYESNADGSTSLDILDIPQGVAGGYYRARNIYDL